jgi:hypothetical protein
MHNNAPPHPRIAPIQWNKMTGTLPPALGNLTELRVLNLVGQNLYGPIPDSFAAMRGLEQFLVSNNKLSGTLPAFFSQLNKLRYEWKGWG